MPLVPPYHKILLVIPIKLNLDGIIKKKKKKFPKKTKRKPQVKAYKRKPSPQINY